MFLVLSQLKKIFAKADLYKLFFLLFLVIFVSILETVGVGLIFPFINLVSHPGEVTSNAKINYLYNLFEFEDSQGFIFALGIFLIVFYFIKNILIASNLYIQQSFIANKRAEISSQLYRYYLKKDYLFHSNNTSAMILRNLNLVDSLFSNFIGPVFAIVSELLTMILIVVLLFLASSETTLLACFAIGIPAIISNKITSKIFKKTGKQSFDYIGKSSQTILDGLRGIKEIKSMNKWSVFTKKLFYYNVQLGKIRAKLDVLNNIPRLLFETIITTGIVLILLFYVRKNIPTEDFFSTIALFGAASVKILSSASKILQKLNIFNFATTLKEGLLEDVILASQDKTPFIESPEQERMQLKKSIEFRNVSFQYPGANKKILKDVSFKILKGEKVAFVGSSGAGKSTVMNILLGLLNIDSGEILIDGVSINENIEKWQRSVGYIPQNITLFDVSLKENIAFGVPIQKIDENKVKTQASLAKLDSFIADLEKGLGTKLGENGSKVSGGQRQRVALARALYLSPSVIFMDEATSALDNKTEKQIVEALEGLNPDYTIIMIAHRLSTVRNCDKIFFMDSGEVTHSGTYDELLHTCSKFADLANLID